MECCNIFGCSQNRTDRFPRTVFYLCLFELCLNSWIVSCRDPYCYRFVVLGKCCGMRSKLQHPLHHKENKNSDVWLLLLCTFGMHIAVQACDVSPKQAISMWSYYIWNDFWDEFYCTCILFGHIFCINEFIFNLHMSVSWWHDLHCSVSAVKMLLFKRPASVTNFNNPS